MSIPRFFKMAFPGYEILDIKEFLQDGRVEVHLGRMNDKQWCCYRCGSALGAQRGSYRSRLEGMPVMGLKLFIFFWRFKGHCGNCKKARAEAVEFIADETPHLTTDLAWWMDRMCEIAAISRVAELMDQDEMTMWRLDFREIQNSNDSKDQRR